MNFLLIVILLVSCEASTDSAIRAAEKAAEEAATAEEAENRAAEEAAEAAAAPKIIGTPIKIGNLEVAQNDFPKWMNWDEANSACEGLGNGWRLPTKDELNLICENYKKIDSAAPYDERYLIENYDRINISGTFWSSTGSNYKDIMWQHTYYFNPHAGLFCYEKYDNKREYCKVRAVNSF